MADILTPPMPSHSSHSTTVLWIEPSAPAKPPEGAPCNGCGLCCLTQPCPLGMVVSLRRKGACSALRWSESEQRYQCGMVSQPAQVLHRLPQWLVRPLAGLLAAAARRWIAAGQGCDADVEVEVGPPNTH